MNVSSANQFELLKKSVKVFPNPSGDHIVINGNISNCTLIIYDPYGMFVKQTNTVNLPINMNISDLSKGIYILKVESKNHKYYSTKFIKQ